MKNLERKKTPSGVFLARFSYAPYKSCKYKYGKMLASIVNGGKQRILKLIFLFGTDGVYDTVSDVYKVVGHTLKPCNNRGIIGASLHAAIAFGKA